MSLRGISRLLRLPLFVTAVADVVAGYFVVVLPNVERLEWRRVALLAGTSTGLYLYGMVQNDLMDRRRDRLLQSGRPLVTGEVGVVTAVVLLVLMAVLAAACAVVLSGGALVLAIGTFVAINLYNLAAKQGSSFVAMTVMGLCRLLNFTMGVAAVAGVPRNITLDMFGPSGPLWIRHGLALFFAAAVVTGYSIAARRQYRVSSRPWMVAFYVTAVAGFGMIALSVTTSAAGFHAPLARVFALLLLAAMWPGGLWSSGGPEREPGQVEVFIPRMLYWLIVLDASFVADKWLMTM
jgi:4-hydroxybenzoate polyprenyltransferase